VRAPAVAGMFYESGLSDLRKNVDDLLGRAQIPSLEGTVRGIVSPHAGYVYSGFTAAHVYKVLQGKKYDCVIGVGPSHREYFDGISVYPGDAYSTPLGEVPINEEMRARILQGDKSIFKSDAGHRLEHSLEVQLPFLQRVLGTFTFVPLIMGDQNRNICTLLSEVIARAASNQNVLLLASSDLSHYHPSDEAVLLDERVLREVKKFDSDTFLEKLERKSFEACGGGPIAVVMKASQLLGANKAEMLHYCNSGDLSGDKSAVVGYLAAAFIQQ